MLEEIRARIGQPGDDQDSRPEDRGEGTLPESVKWQRKNKDAELLSDSAMPETEDFRLGGLLVAECFLPSQTTTLLGSLRSLEWDDPVEASGRLKVDDWITRARRISPYQGAYRSLGPMVPSDAPGRLAGRPLKIDLPADVFDYGWGRVIQPIPSVTTVVLQMALTEEASKLVQEPFLTEYHTTAEPIDNGYAITDPLQHRKNDFYEVRETIRSIVGDWFSRNLPGSFSSRNEAYPVTEFFSFEEQQPLPDDIKNGEDDEDSSDRTFLRAVSLEGGFAAYKASDVPSLRILADQFGDDNPYSYCLAGRLDDLRNELFSLDDSSGLSYISNRCLHHFEMSFGTLALGALLGRFESDLGRYRDELASVSDDTPNILGTIRDVEEKLLGGSQDFLPVCNEFSQLCERRLSSQEGTSTDYPPVGLAADRRQGLFQRLWPSWKARISHLLAMEETIRNLCISAANAEYSKVQDRLANESYEIQKQVESLARLQVFFAVLLVIFAAVQVMDTINISFSEVTRTLRGILYSIWPR